MRVDIFQGRQVDLGIGLRALVTQPETQVDVFAAMLEKWNPDPAFEWVTAIPNSGETDRVSDFARRVAERLGVAFVPAVVRIASNPPQAQMFNSAQQLSNVRGVFEVHGAQSGPVLLIDDMVDSRWTLTAVGHLLRTADVAAVYPAVLLDASRGGV